MSKDSCHTYIHSHASHHADLFEEFCHPPSASASSGANNSGTSPHHHHSHQHGGSGGTGANSGDPSMIHVPGHFLPFEEIHLPPYLMPVNPEDEDDVVPDMHAAFGIQRALNGAGGATGQAGSTGDAGRGGEGSGRGTQQEPVWRDLGLDRLMEGRVGQGGEMGARREGKKAAVLTIR